MEGNEQLEALMEMGMSMEEALAVVYGEEVFEDREEEERRQRREALLLRPPEHQVNRDVRGKYAGSLRAYGSYVASKCGYCKGVQTSSNFAFTLKSATPQLFETLLDNGFCCSGSWCYKSLGEVSCCALYSIRLDLQSDRFKWSEHNLETRRKMEKFLNDLSSETAAAEKRKAEDKVSIAIVAAVTDALKLAELIPDERLYVRRPSKPNQCYGIPIANLIRCVKTNLTSDQLCDLIRSNWNKESSIECPIVSEGYLHFRNCLFEAETQQYNNKKQRFESDSAVNAKDKKKKVLTVDLEEASFSEEKFALFKLYQSSVHNDEEATEESFVKNYVKSSVVREPPRNQHDHPMGLGMMHMVYRIDGELCGCGVVIFCPNMLVSVYFFWNKNKFRSSGLGNYSQLCEIDLAMKYRNLRFYNLVLHCPTSAKMGYKLRNYIGTEILCPYTRRYQIYDDRVRALIEEKGYTRLEANDEIESLSLARFDGRAVFELDMEMRPGVIATYATARAMMEDPVAFESRYVELAFQLGPQLSTEMLILLHRE